MRFTPDLQDRLRTLYAQSFRITLAPYVLPRLLARSQPGLLSQVPSFSSLLIELYVTNYFFTHAASLHQGFLHCAISPTAASRRSLGRVSVPMWPSALSGRLLIVALVSRYLTNWLIRRGSIIYHRGFSHSFMRSCALMRYQHLFLSVIPLYMAGYPRVTHPSATNRYFTRFPYLSVRLACVRHAASVHPEPGSNSHVLFHLIPPVSSGFWSLFLWNHFLRFPLLFSLSVASYRCFTS